MKRTTGVLAGVIAVVLAGGGFAAGWSAAGGHEHGLDVSQKTTPFTGTIASMYPDGTGGCVAADGGQGVELGNDRNCGPFFNSQVKAKVGAAVVAVPFSLADATSGEAIDGYLISRGDFSGATG